MKKTMTVKEVASYTGYSPNTIYNFVFYKKIPFERISQKKVVFYKDRIDRWLEDKKQDKAKEAASDWIQDVLEDRRRKNEEDVAAPPEEKKREGFRRTLIYPILVVAAFIVGVLINPWPRREQTKESAVSLGESKKAASGMKDVINQAKISGIQISPVASPEDNTVKVRLDNVSNIELNGEATSDVILPILERTLKAKEDDYANKATALDVVQPYASNESITKTLIFVLANDENPAIRMKTLSILEKEARKNFVKDAILDCIKKDANEAVRFRALEVLEKVMDQQVIDVLSGIKERDESLLLRKRADALYKKYAKQI